MGPNPRRETLEVQAESALPAYALAVDHRVGHPLLLLEEMMLVLLDTPGDLEGQQCYLGEDR